MSALRWWSHMTHICDSHPTCTGESKSLRNFLRPNFNSLKEARLNFWKVWRGFGATDSLGANAISICTRYHSGSPPAANKPECKQRIAAVRWKWFHWGSLGIIGNRAPVIHNDWDQEAIIIGDRPSSKRKRKGDLLEPQKRIQSASRIQSAALRDSPFGEYNAPGLFGLFGCFWTDECALRITTDSPIANQRVPPASQGASLLAAKLFLTFRH